MDMSINQRVTEAVKYLIFANVAEDKKGLAQMLGYNISAFSQIINGRVPTSEKFIDKLVDLAPYIRKEWLLYGEGSMLEADNDLAPEDTRNSVPLLPISAIGGSLTGFDPSVAISDCERILSPINGADFAIEVYGDSMAPEYPSGARILIKRIDMEAFIEWGRVYVLATTNGTVIKEVFPHGEEAVECRSVNATYPPFFIRYKDIHAMYRVLMCMTLK